MSDAQSCWLGAVVVAAVWCSIVAGSYWRMQEARACQSALQEHGEVAR